MTVINQEVAQSTALGSKALTSKYLQGLRANTSEQLNNVTLNREDSVAEHLKNKLKPQNDAIYMKYVKCIQNIHVDIKNM